MTHLPAIADGFTDDQRRILTALAGATGALRSDRVLTQALGEPVGTLESALITDAWRAPTTRQLAAYRTLVLLAQPFTTRYPLVIGTGNFGTRDDDPPADVAFTSARLSAVGAAALAGTVPHLLINGAPVRAGASAVGCLPHHLGDVLGAARALLAKPSLSDDELIDLVPGPDFPSGGALTSRSTVRAIYQTGAGRLPVRGRAAVAASSIGPAVVVTELPFTVGPTAFLAELGAGVADGRLPAIADLLDESDQRGLRIAIAVRAGAEPAALRAALFAETSLTIELAVDAVALTDGTAQRVTLPALLRAYAQSLTERGTRAPALIEELFAMERALGDARRTAAPPA